MASRYNTSDLYVLPRSCIPVAGSSSVTDLKTLDVVVENWIKDLTYQQSNKSAWKVTKVVPESLTVFVQYIVEVNTEFLFSRL